jgi:hypothetical protein
MIKFTKGNFQSSVIYSIRYQADLQHICCALVSVLTSCWDVVAAFMQSAQ